MLKSFIIAFSTYSKIPMPNIKWDKKNMKYSMCCFPFVGFVIGFALIACNKICLWLDFGSLIKGVLFTAIPIMITGGIHMDGFMDTIDAKSSYASKEKRLEILKDPHAGAFAIIFCCLYLLVSVSLFASLENIQIVYVAFGYIYSRILSGLSVVTFKKAKKEGMVSDTAKHASAGVKWILHIELFVFMIAIITGSFCYGNMTHRYFLVWYGVAVVVSGLLAFMYYGYTAKKWFGGITGDLAGYFLQICELWILIGVMVLGKLI